MNMGDLIRIAFCVIAVALFGCQPSPLPQSSYLLDDFNIPFLKEDVKCENVRLYSPQNVKPNCITSALECVQKELKVVKVECDDEMERIFQANQTLAMKIEERKSNENGNAQSNPTECACEKWPEASYDEFLKNYETLLQFEKVQSSQ